MSAFEPVWLWNDPVTGYLCRGPLSLVPVGVRAVELEGGVEVMPDVKPGFNRSAGCFIGSRSEREEMMRREGLRVVERGDPERQLAEHERRRSEAIRRPKVGLAESHYEVFQAAGGDRKDVRRMLEESERGGDAQMERRWRDGQVRR